MTFDEITKKGVKEGMAHPRAINEDLFNAQQARRVLDRLVGYKLSPFLWRKVRRGLSAGRVQSVAVRIIDDREKEIEASSPRNTGTWTPPWVWAGRASRPVWPPTTREKSSCLTLRPRPAPSKRASRGPSTPWAN